MNSINTNDTLPGVAPRWVDKQKGFARKHAAYPLEIILALNRARDIGVPASTVEDAIRKVIEQMQGSML